MATLEWMEMARESAWELANAKSTPAIKRGQAERALANLGMRIQRLKNLGLTEETENWAPIHKPYASI